MPPWANDPAPPGPRRLAVQPAPIRRPNPPTPRRITEYFNHKMKPQNGIKRDSSAIINDDPKKKCLPKNCVDLTKYISYLTNSLNTEVTLDVNKQSDATRRPIIQTCDTNYKEPSNSNNGITDVTRLKVNMETNFVNGFVDSRRETVTYKKDQLNTFIDPTTRKPVTRDLCANGLIIKPANSGSKPKVPIPHAHIAFRITPNSHLPKKLTIAKPDSTRTNEVVSSTTKLDSRMNAVTCGSNNLSLNSVNKSTLKNRELTKKSTQTTKRTNRKSSACIANSKNLTWSKANNLKQVQLQKQVFSKSVQVPAKNSVPEANAAPKLNMPNGVRQVSMTVNGNLSNIPTPVTNFQNCHQINLTQPCNGTVTSNNLTSFVAVPSNVMLTTLRIPQNGLPAQPLSQQNNLAATFNRPNVNVSSPTKLNGSFVFPLMQNLNGTVVQIPNFVLPASPQLGAQRQDHLQNQQTAQFLINGTLLKLANTLPAAYTNHKSSPVTSQPIPMMNKNVPGMQTVGMTVQPKPNFTVNLSHPMLMPQPGFIVTSVPNMNVKETWSYTGTNTVTSSQTSCSNPIVHHQSPLMANYSTQTVQTSSVPIVPVKPPDNPIQGTDPPSSTVVEPEMSDAINLKCDIPWLSKTINNNILQFDPNKLSSRPFAQLRNCSEKIEIKTEKISNTTTHLAISEVFKNTTTGENLKKVQEVARREETIFTQITVLKDVSSTVQSTLIETNYSGATTESSESGIGTDKSIDSPSDSQASKECDEDSSLSLSVSISSVEVENSQKSPILKQPKILRFPPKITTKPGTGKRKSSSSSAIVVCLWENCKEEFQNDMDLLAHLQSHHVETQAGRENYVCLWEQCKVRGKPSCSRLWLERHTLSHGGNKPFKCIVDSCNRRFSTQILLERHVNNHFNEASPNTNGSRKTTDSAAKLIRRNGKKLRYRRQPWSARMFDFFDAGMMEGLAWRLLRGTRWRLAGSCPLREPPGRHTLTLLAAITATRHNAAAARTEALLTYYPPDVIDDEWVPESEVKRVKRVEICHLPARTKVMLYERFCNSYLAAPSVAGPPAAVAPVAGPPVAGPPVAGPPARLCTSSRLLNDLLAGKKNTEAKDACSAASIQLVYAEDEGEKIVVSGAKKRKMGRRYGGNSFWPCGR